MGCGCLSKNKVEIISKIKEPNENFDVHNVVNNNNPSSSNLSDDNNNNEEGRENANINNNNRNRNNINSPHIQDSSPNSNSNQNNIVLRQNNLNSQNSPNNNNISNQNNNNFNSNNNNNYLNNLQNILNNVSDENNLSLGPAYEPYLQSKQDENFNYKEVENEFVGIGVKRMQGYISPVSFEKLQKIREDFWTSRIEGNPEIWEILRTICNDNTLTLDDIDSFMKSSNIVTYKGCINVTYDSKGYLYEIPNYCINDPVRYENIEEEKSKDIPKEENIEVKIRCFVDEGKIKIKNHESIEKLKDIISKHKTFINKFKCDSIRLFFGGKELQNEKPLYFYNIENKSIIQMLARPAEKKNENENNVSIASKNQCLKSRALSGVTLSGENHENDENENLEDTLTDQNKLLIKVKNK